MAKIVAYKTHIRGRSFGTRAFPSGIAAAFLLGALVVGAGQFLRGHDAPLLALPKIGVETAALPSGGSDAAIAAAFQICGAGPPRQLRRRRRHVLGRRHQDPHRRHRRAGDASGALRIRSKARRRRDAKAHGASERRAIHARGRRPRRRPLRAEAQGRRARRTLARRRPRQRGAGAGVDRPPRCRGA